MKRLLVFVQLLVVQMVALLVYMQCQPVVLFARDIVALPDVSITRVLWIGGEANRSGGLDFIAAELAKKAGISTSQARSDFRGTIVISLQNNMAKPITEIEWGLAVFNDSGGIAGYNLAATNLNISPGQITSMLGKFNCPYEVDDNTKSLVSIGYIRFADGTSWRRPENLKDEELITLARRGLLRPEDRDVPIAEQQKALHQASTIVASEKQ